MAATNGFIGSNAPHRMHRATTQGAGGKMQTTVTLAAQSAAAKYGHTTPEERLHAFHSSLCYSSTRGLGKGSVLNVIDGKQYLHHPVMFNVPIQEYDLEKDWLVEINGLRIPAAYDCDIFNGDLHWGAFPYFFKVPSRWHACWSHLDAICGR